MTKTIVAIVFLVVFILVPLMSFADMGIGVILGEPSGVSFRIGNFPVATVGWSFTNRIDATLDFWIINDDFIEFFDWYLGVGLRTGIKINQGNDNTSIFALAVRVPIGLQWWIIENLELFVEAAPGVAILPSFGFDAGGGIGIRYFF